MLYGMDISNIQKGIDLTKGTYDFCIIKATEGIGFTDKSFSKFAVQLTKMSKLIGCYHFARPDLHCSLVDMQREAEYFVEVLEKNNLIGKAILVLDWEREPFDNEQLIEIWLTRVQYLTGVTPFIYGSSSKFNQWSKWDIIKEYRIWRASWPSIKRFQVGENPGLSLPSNDWNIWQYSSTGIYPEYSGNIDLDMTNLRRDEWLDLCSTKTKENISPYMQWAIDFGLFVGDGEGKYSPKGFLTREQAAILFYKYHQLTGGENK